MSEKILQQLQEKERQIKARIKQEQAKIKAKERQIKNKRLAEVGAILEKAVGEEFVEKSDRKILLDVLTEKRSDNNNCEYTIAEIVKNTYKKRKEKDFGIIKAKPVICIDNGMEFESMAKAANWLQINRQYISDCCHGRIDNIEGFHFKFKEVEK